MSRANYPPPSPYWPPRSRITSREISNAKHAQEKHHKSQGTNPTEKTKNKLKHFQSIKTGYEELNKKSGMNQDIIRDINKYLFDPSNSSISMQELHSIIDVARDINDTKNIIYATELILRKKGHEVIDEPDSLGHTLFHSAVIYNNVYLVKALHKLGANVNIDGDKWSASKRTKLSGDTPLHDAVYNGKYEMVFTLINLGADVNIVNNKNKTALDIAHSKKNDGVDSENIIRLLIRMTDGVAEELKEVNDNRSRLKQLQETNSFFNNAVISRKIKKFLDPRILGKGSGGSLRKSQKRHKGRTHKGRTHKGRTHKGRTHKGRTHKGRTHKGRTHKGKK